MAFQWDGKPWALPIPNLGSVTKTTLQRSLARPAWHRGGEASLAFQAQPICCQQPSFEQALRVPGEVSTILPAGGGGG